MRDGKPPVFDAPVVIVTGHYGVGKTNLTLNLAIDHVEHGFETTVVDLDVVNPYFRSGDYRALLEEHGIRLVAPVFAGTNLDIPSLTGRVVPAIEWAQEQGHSGAPRMLVIDVGGDDVGATALGQFARTISRGYYEMLYVVNRNRDLTQEPSEAVSILHEIESRSHLRMTAVVNNTHLQAETDEETLMRGMPFAETVAEHADLPLAFTTVPVGVADSLPDRKTPRIGRSEGQQTTYPVQVYVCTPWDN